MTTEARTEAGRQLLAYLVGDIGLVQERLWFKTEIAAIESEARAAALREVPEEDFGLYAYSRLFCKRCGKTFEWRPGFER